jgi:hypothetical protein
VRFSSQYRDLCRRESGLAFLLCCGSKDIICVMFDVPVQVGRSLESESFAL